MRRALFISLVTLSITIGTSQSATASQILFMAQQFPCFGATTPKTCLPGGLGFPVEWGGPNYVPVNLPANSLIEEIDLWGENPQAAGIWDSTTVPNIPFTVVIPGHEVAAIAQGSIDITTTLFGIDGINGAPYFFLQGILHTPIFLQGGGRYYVGVGGFGLAGGSDVVWHAPGFTTDVDPSALSSRVPGDAIQVVGQVVPEPSTIGLVGFGIVILCMRRDASLQWLRR